jgi:hypothetical protein
MYDNILPWSLYSTLLHYAEATLIRGGTIILKVVVSETNRFRVVARVAGEADSGAGGAAAAGQHEGGS